MYTFVNEVALPFTTFKEIDMKNKTKTKNKK